MSLKLLSILLIILATIIGGAYPFFKKLRHNQVEALPLVDAFIRGIFLGAGLLHMLYSSSKMFLYLGDTWLWAALYAGIIFFVLLGLEYRNNKAAGFKTEHLVVLTVVILSVHSLLAGIALGLSANIAMTVIILIALLAHKSAASFALSRLITKSQFSKLPGALLFIVFAFMAPLGIYFGMHIHVSGNNLAEAIFLSIAAGTFLYLGGVHDLKRVQFEATSKLAYFMCLALGFILMAIIKFYA